MSQKQFAAAVLALLPLIWLLAPSVAWYDSGELAATATQLGVPHPTGFALFNLAGHALTKLPLGPAALRVHLLGALCAVLASALLRPSGDRGTLLRTSFILLPLAAPAVLLHVRTTEVYPLVWLHAAALLAAIAQLHLGQKTVWVGALFGLGAGIHAESLLLGGGAWLFCAQLDLRQKRFAPVLLSVAMGSICGLVLLYLPLAALRLPDFSWGDLRSWDALRDHLTAASIRAAFADQMHGGWVGFALLAQLIWRDARFLLAPALLGALALQKTQPKWLIALLALIAVDAAYSALINPMGLRDDQAGLLALLGLGVLAGEGIAVLFEGQPVAQIAAILGFTAVLAQQAVSARSPRDVATGARLADALWRNVPAGALLVTSSDHLASACAWTQTAEGARPDSLCFPGVFARSPRQLHLLAQTRGLQGGEEAAVLAWQYREPQRILAAWLQPALAQRPVLWEVGLPLEDAQIIAHLQYAFPWHRLVEHNQTVEERKRNLAAYLAQIGDFCRAQADDCRDTPTLNQMVATQLEVLAALIAPKDQASARQLLDTALTLDVHNARALHNLAVLELPFNPEKALQLCAIAIKFHPDYLRSHKTAARAALRLDKPDLARDHALQWLNGRTADDKQQWINQLVAEMPKYKLQIQRW